ncbi:pectinesterase inhibitor 10-like protein [Tanacetum coccineum]
MVKLAEVHGMSLREISAMKDCIELLGDSVYELKQSLDKMTYPGSKGSGLVMSDIQTWVSSAMKDEETCVFGSVHTSHPHFKQAIALSSPCNLELFWRGVQDEPSWSKKYTITGGNVANFGIALHLLVNGCYKLHDDACSSPHMSIVDVG